MSISMHCGDCESTIRLWFVPRWLDAAKLTIRIAGPNHHFSDRVSYINLRSSSRAGSLVLPMLDLEDKNADPPNAGAYRASYMI